MIKKILLVALLPLLSFCGTTSGDGVSVVGNPTSRLVEGDVDSSSSSLSLAKQASSNCVADKVIATDTSGIATTEDISSDCSFAVSLTIDRSYAFSFSLRDQFVASMLFNNNANRFDDSHMVLSSGSTAIRFGRVSFTNRRARPAREPSTQNDRDGDGFFDFDDDDDDNDGTGDENEQDCDLDGIDDSLDRDTRSCDPEDITDSSERLLQVRPRNNPDPSLIDERVDTDEEIRFRTSCQLDRSTVSNDNVIIVAADNPSDIISCEFEFEENDTRVECEHEDDFTVNTTYTAAVQGLRCSNGSSIRSKTWSWATESED